MAYGLQTFFGNGALQLNITDRLTRLVQSNYVYLNARSSTTIYVPGMANNGRWGVLAGSPFAVSIGNGYYTVFNAEYDYGSGITLMVFQY